jgi:ribonuclease R
VKENFQQHYLLGEVVYSKDRGMSILDLYTGEAFVVQPLPNIPKLSNGQTVQFVLRKGIPKQINILASGGSVHAQLYKIAAGKKLSPFFSSLIQDEVEKILDNTGIDDPVLNDMESLAFCTIDGEDTLDLDQALQVEKTQTGFIVRYAIADAAYYIKPDSALFEEALKRGTSYYLPGLMIPMLPRELCVDVISLNENVSRRAIVFEIILNHSGQHLKTHIVRARIKSRGKLSFKEVEIFFEQSSKSIRDDEQLATSLTLFKKVGLLRLKLAEERNVARFHRTEVNVKLGQNGLIFNLLDNVRNDVELYNEQFSLLCNIAGAKLLADKDESLAKFIQPIYKVHPPPSKDKLKEFENSIKQLIQVHELDAKVWHWQPLKIMETER